MKKVYNILQRCYETFLSSLTLRSNKLERLSLAILSILVPQNFRVSLTQIEHLSLTRTRLEKLARNKHSSLLSVHLTYEGVNIYRVDTRCQCYKTFFLCRR
jgi:hypothetical protein